MTQQQAIRWLTAVAVLVSGAVHLKLWFDGFRDIAVIGPSFLLNAGGAVAIAVLLVAWRHWLPALLAVGFGLATLGAFVISATVGLFGVHEVWTGTAQVVSAASEVVAVLGGVAVLARLRPRTLSSAVVAPSRRRSA
ncbi:hypothetical protein [Angustibacter sp. Root456]|uniref:hypothetical protein n=1 Tax=Angustibacter sp. Root456 TaxID=1736539 RepID=UPI0006F3015D|nr:hypothetical protein [Angustibacter sp. Root456]KQX65682.1 hypothetical protein ASD06_08620 [Angustibacter sp. Root456]